MVATMGLVAGNGRLPVELSIAAVAAGHSVVVAAVGDEMDGALEPLSQRYTVFEPGHLQNIIDYFKSCGAASLVMAGKVNKQRLYRGAMLDARFVAMMAKLPETSDDALMCGIAGEFESEGILVEPQSKLLAPLMPSEGVLTSAEPTPAQWADIEYGYNIAKHIGLADIGQTVVVKNRAVMAVEAIEGTDECIRRGGSLANGGAVAVKVVKPNQDMRFDIPSIGVNTIVSMAEAHVAVLAVEARATFFVDKESTLNAAMKAGIVVVATVGTAYTGVPKGSAVG